MVGETEVGRPPQTGHWNPVQLSTGTWELGDTQPSGLPWEVSVTLQGEELSGANRRKVFPTEEE